MEFIRLGKTNLMVSRSALDTAPLFGAAQNGLLSGEALAGLLHTAYEEGINFFQISCGEKPPAAVTALFGSIESIRESIRLAAVSSAQNAAALKADAVCSLLCLQTDYLDLYQIRDPGFVPVPGGADGLYDGLQILRDEGVILHTGFITDNFAHLCEAVSSSLYETVQFPFNFLVPEEQFSCIDMCLQTDTGFIASDPLAGGRIENIPLAFGFFRGKENTVPMWRIKNDEELRRILYFEKQPPVIDERFF